MNLLKYEGVSKSFRTES